MLVFSVLFSVNWFSFMRNWIQLTFIMLCMRVVLCIVCPVLLLVLILNSMPLWSELVRSSRHSSKRARMSVEHAARSMYSWILLMFSIIKRSHFDRLLLKKNVCLTFVALEKANVISPIRRKDSSLTSSLIFGNEVILITL